MTRPIPPPALGPRAPSPTPIVHGYPVYGAYPCGAEQTYGSLGPGPCGISDATGEYISSRPVTCPGCIAAIAKHAADCAVAR